VPVTRMPLPIQEAVRDLTGDLLGRGTAVDKIREPIAPDDMALVAGYRDDHGVLQALVPADRQLVPVLGGSLVMVPEVVIKEVLGKGELPDHLVENYWEVANIMASLLNRTGGAHVVLADRTEGFADLEDDARALLAAPVRQRWFSVTVQGYGTGRMGFVAAT
jgi:hypothetical protein